MIAIFRASKIKTVTIATIFSTIAICLMSCSAYKRGAYFQNLQSSNTKAINNISAKPESSVIYTANLNHDSENYDLSSSSLIVPNLIDSSASESFLDFKVSVFGDVLKPGVYPFSSKRMTITEAISTAGELNTTAIRKKILLVREINGERKYIAVDLTSKNLSNSPFYFLKNNDVIYADPGKMKDAEGSSGYKTGALILSALSITTIVLSALAK